MNNFIEEQLAEHNDNMRDTISKYCLVTDSHLYEYGKDPNKYEVGLPLEKTEIAVNLSGDEDENRLKLLIQTSKMCDLKDFLKSFKHSAFNPVNDLEYEDYLEERKKFPLFTFLNGDGKPIPAGPDGSTFGNNHTHFTASSEWTDTAIRDVITNVAEHGVLGELIVCINPKDEDKIDSMKSTGSFHEFLSPKLTISRGEFPNPLQTLPPNRSIGYFDACEVWLKPWVDQDYLIVIDTGVDEVKDNEGNVIRPAVKPFGYRYSSKHSLNLVAQYDDEGKLTTLQRYYGVNPINRHMVAAHYFGPSQGSYVAPTWGIQ